VKPVEPPAVTTAFGKNHLGDYTDALPTARGFQDSGATCITSTRCSS
jgi:hypothetical protein